MPHPEPERRAGPAISVGLSPTFTSCSFSSKRAATPEDLGTDAFDQSKDRDLRGKVLSSSEGRPRLRGSGFSAWLEREGRLQWPDTSSRTRLMTSLGDDWAHTGGVGVAAGWRAQ